MIKLYVPANANSVAVSPTIVVAPAFARLQILKSAVSVDKLFAFVSTNTEPTAILAPPVASNALVAAGKMLYSGSHVNEVRYDRE